MQYIKMGQNKNLKKEEKLKKRKGFVCRISNLLKK
jgi:hypothetical protein